MVFLHGIGHFYPENEVTNRFLAELDIGSDENWILERVGIETRRTVLPLSYIRETKNRDVREAQEASLYSNARTGALAARMALGRAGVPPEEIGLVISGSSASCLASPAEAVAVAAELGLDVPCFDIHSACTTFGVQMHYLGLCRPEAVPAFVLVVTAENLTPSIDYSDRRTACLLGDGSVAAVVSLSVPSPVRIRPWTFSAQPQLWRHVVLPRTAHFWQDGNAVQGFAIRRTSQLLKEIQAGEPDATRASLKFIGHQANGSMLRTVCERCDISPENHWSNVVRYGNTGSAGAPGTLSLHWDQLQAGDRIALIQVGAGLSWASSLVTVQNGGGLP